MIICIVGPTGIGKSKLAIEVAKKLHGEIINGDAFQIYKEMDIGTAKPTLEERNEVPHHLFDYVEPTYNFSVFDYQTNLRNKIAELEKQIYAMQKFNDVQKQPLAILYRYIIIFEEEIQKHSTSSQVY